MSSPVSDHLISLLAREVKRHAVLVWYDPGGSFGQFAQSAQVEHAHIVRFTDSYYRLRHEMEEAYAAFDRDSVATLPGLILYVSRAPLQPEMDVLRGPSCAGGTFEMSLAAVAREALKERLTTARLDALLGDERLTLDDLDRLGSGPGNDPSVVGLVFGTGSVAEVAVRYLGDPTWRDLARALDERKGRKDLAALFSTGLGLPAMPKASHDALRRALARHVLLAAFRAGLSHEEHPVALAAFPQPAAPEQVAACSAIAAGMRDRASMRAAYVRWATEAQEEVGLAELTLPVVAAEGETFPLQDDLLLRQVVSETLRAGDGGPSDGWTALQEQARHKATGFWAQAEAGRDVAWHVVASVVDLLAEANRVQTELRTLPTRALPADIVSYYTQEGRQGQPAGAWYRLDARHREVEYVATGLADARAHDDVEPVVRRARERHRQAIEMLNSRFIAALETAGFVFGSMAAQGDTYHRRVRPALDSALVAYLLVDALRFEMGAELFASLQGTGRLGDATLTPAIGVVPTITPIGMAALLPGADEGVGLAAAGGDVAAIVKGQVFKDYAARKGLWQSTFGDRLVDLNLGEVLTLRPDTLRKRLVGKTLALVRSQEIDEFGEQGNLYQARRTMTEVIGDVKKAVNLLCSAGVGRFVVAADHGHLLLEDLTEDQKIDPPGGETVSLHRRCWVGRGGATAPGLLRLKAADMGMGGDLELAFPRGLGAFKAGGATSYFHGGLSLQELVVPVLSFTLLAPRGVNKEKTGFSLGFPQGKITNRVFTLTARFEHYQHSLLDDSPASAVRRVRCDAWDGKRGVAVALSALAGFDASTAEITLQAGQDNTVTLLMEPDIEGEGTVRLRLLDAETGAELSALPGVSYDLSF